MRLLSILTVLALCLALCLALSACGWILGKTSGAMTPHLTDSPDPNPIRPINGGQVGEARFVETDGADPLDEQLNELIKIVADNKNRPVFNDSSAPETEAVYLAAVAVLDRYILNWYNDFRRVHAIHDYLISQVKYDEQLYAEYLSGGEIAHDNDSFLLTGVFLNKVAVCDGFAAAFRLLCGIEGIETESVEGAYVYDGANQPHKWNRVKLDGAWYNVDVTMDSHTVNSDAAKPIILIHHGFFLLSDATLSGFGSHIFQGGNPDYYAESDYDFYSKEILYSQDGRSSSMEVTSVDELTAAFKYVKAQKRKIGQIELRLNMGLDPTSADLSDAYSDAIKAAYKSVSDRNFSYNPEKGIIPFLKYPRGVFVFLIYK